jgi:hypothetical protein
MVTELEALVAALSLTPGKVCVYDEWGREI